MLSIVKNFAVAFALTAVIASVVCGTLAGIVVFFYWLSAGAIWGLLSAIVTIFASFVGVAFATSEARK